MTSFAPKIDQQQMLENIEIDPEQTLLDQRLFLVTFSQSQTLLSLLDGPARDNPGLKDLFHRHAPWVE